MSRLLSRYWLLLPILIALVIVLDRIEAPGQIEEEETIDMRETRSDYYLAGFRSRKFGAGGKIEYTVSGETLAHYPDTDRSQITEPRIELHQTDTNWQIQSHTGSFDTVPELFTLQGEVIVKRQREGSGAVIIRTSRLTVAVRTNEVATSEPIVISAPTWQLQATGLKSAIDDGKLSLLSQVTGRYEIPDAP